MTKRLREKSLKEKLLEDPSLKAYGAFLMSSSPVLAEVMGCCGFGCLIVDLEHSPLEFEGALHMLQAVRATSTPVIIRVALGRPELIKKALDLGPDGLLVPLVDSAADAKAIVAACRYPPRGIRGVAPRLVRASRWGTDPEYIEKCEERLLLLCQVETATSVSNVEEILSVDGVDGIFVGPADLSTSLGHINNIRHPDVIKACETIEAAAKKHPQKILTGYAGARTVDEMFQHGYRLVFGTADVGLLKDAALANVAANTPK